jgi:hypothetical protein
MLVAEGFATEEQLAGWRDEAELEVDETAARVQREPEPDPAEEEWNALSTRELEDHFA